MSTKIRKSTLINVPPSKIWPIVSNVENIAKISPAVAEAKITSNGTHGPGTTFELTIDMAGLKIKGSNEVTFYEPDLRVAWKSTKGLENSGEIRLIPRGEGTHVSFTVEYTVPGGAMLGNLADKLGLEKLNEDNAQGMLDELKRTLEN
jgi:uncharacterized membrane protein